MIVGVEETYIDQILLQQFHPERLVFGQQFFNLFANIQSNIELKMEKNVSYMRYSY